MGVVYKILNIKTGAFYIGSTKNKRKRWNEHKNDLLKNIHHCAYLQRSYNKHGKDCFVYEILANVPEEYLRKLEQWFVDNLKPEYNSAKDVIRPLLGRKWTELEKKKVSNKHKGNTYNLGRKASDETKALMSKTRLGKKHTEESIKKMKKLRLKPILQYNINGGFIREFVSVTSAAEHVNTTRQNISKTLAGHQATSAGFIWKYKF